MMLIVILFSLSGVMKQLLPFVGSVSVDFEVAEGHVSVMAEVETYERTGVEMEALTACSVAALTIYDMCKSIDKGMVISDLALLEKTGGKSGTYIRN